MGDFYTEQLVKQKSTGVTVLKKAGLIVAIIIGVFIMLMNPVLVIIPALLIWLAIFLFKRMDLEFEYLYFNGDLDIDKIMGMQARKRVFSTSIKDIEVVAPSGSVELQQYRNLKAMDFSSKEENAKFYEMVATHKGQKVRVIFEPNEKILKEMHLLAPRKVFI
ncbi:MAG: hypothetical protein IJZ53_07340 [Tyzzerella sp.]|nr:hypothetical protein [Tyzzerella sp.]